MAVMPKLHPVLLAVLFCQNLSNGQDILSLLQGNARSNDQLCKLFSGQCVESSRCVGRVMQNLCHGSDAKECCVGIVVQSANVQVKDSQCAAMNGNCVEPGNCDGAVFQGLCAGHVNKQCCRVGVAASSTETRDPEQMCKDKGGNCVYYWNCQGQVENNLCPDTNKGCCTTADQAPISVDPEQKCKDRSGNCVHTWLCEGTTVYNLCQQGSGKECCIRNAEVQVPQNGVIDNRCRAVSGTCIQTQLCIGTIMWGRCQQGPGIECCVVVAAPQDPEQKCKDKGGVCTQTWACRGDLAMGLCRESAGKECCSPRDQASISVDPEQKCKDRGGDCVQTWLCEGTAVYNLCQQGSGEECCIRNAEVQVPQNGVIDKRCRAVSGTCIQTQLCIGTIMWGRCQQGPGIECCVVVAAPQDPEQKCKDKGGVCTQSWACRGDLAMGLCQESAVKECCLPRDQAPISIDPEQKCKDRGGNCVQTWRLCAGTTVYNLCRQGSGKECCIRNNPETECKEKGGTCKFPWNCRGKFVSGYCGQGFGKGCCLPLEVQVPQNGVFDKRCRAVSGTCIQTRLCAGKIMWGRCQQGPGIECCVVVAAPVDIEKECKDRGGTCTNSWECRGSLIWNYCGTSGKACCLSSVARPEPEEKCKGVGGTCMQTWKCSGTIHWNYCQQGTQKQCCVVTDPEKECKEKGGTCKFTWNCRGRIVMDYCGQKSGKGCCLPQEQVTPTRPTPCKKYGGQCTYSHCHEILYPHQVFEQWLCEENTHCCMDDPDKKCKDACGKCVDERKCDGKIVTGLCGGDLVCCFKIDKRKDAGCIAKGGANAVCMEIACDGYFVKCNKNTQSAFCPGHKKMECCMPAGKKLKAGAKDCKGAGGKCDCNPCDGVFYKNAPGKTLCRGDKECCIIDPQKKCKDGGGKCQRKAVKCNGPYLSGFCGPGAAVCCFEADFTKIPTNGASATTAKGQGLDTNKFKGTGASDELARQDVPHLNKMKAQINAVAAKTGIDAAIIAAIISRETRGGRAHHLKNPKSYGAMQHDTAKMRTKGQETSQKHIQEATEHFIKGLGEVFKKHLCWSMATKLKGAIAAYNAGSNDVDTIDKMDKGTTGDDYSDDVVARAKWLRKNGHF